MMQETHSLEPFLNHQLILWICSMKTDHKHRPKNTLHRSEPLQDRHCCSNVVLQSDAPRWQSAELSVDIAQEGLSPDLADIENGCCVGSMADEGLGFQKRIRWIKSAISGRRCCIDRTSFVRWLISSACLGNVLNYAVS